MRDSQLLGLEPPDTPPPDDQPSVRDFLRERSLKRELIAELRSSWQGGNPASVQDLLQRWPTDPGADGDVASLLFEDYLQRARSAPDTQVKGLDGAVDQQESVAELLRHHEMLRSIGVSNSGDSYLRMPEIGEELFGFKLCHELGRGAFARVFLARQADLAGRPVVLKVSKIEGAEAQTLAQLQHTNIVPIYSVHENERAGLRALCMPYFGGASLSDVLKNAWQTTPTLRKGEELIQALDRVASRPQEGDSAAEPLPPFASGDQTPRGQLAQLPYARAAAWIVAALADGLAHAHQRGILHRDIKPSNILLASDGQPMLLDFNLAQDASQEGAHATLGGTIAYMSPEHLRALSLRSPALARTIDRRADIYSLGMVLYEMLSGRSPFDQSASYTPLPMLVEAMALERGRCTPSLRQARPDAPWNLEAIARRCLDPDPARRYQRAEELAEDLRRFLDDRPLRHAPELSLKERGRKWIRRHPRLYWAGLITAVSACLLLAAVFGLLSVRGQLARTSDQLAVSRAEDRKRDFENGTLRALFYVNTRDELRDHLTLGEAACRETLDLYEILDRPDWQDNADWKRLQPADRARLAEDARDLLLLLAGARVRLAKWDADALRQSLELLDRAERVPGVTPCQALWIDRAAYLRRLGDEAAADEARRHAEALPAATARDHYLLAMAYARQQNYARAIPHLNEAVRLNPQDYWSWMQRGLCHQDAGKTALAVGDFGTCVGLRTDFAWGYYNRAVALTLSGQKPEALLDYTKALELDPQLLPARVNCGILHLETEQYAAALTDFQEVARAGRDDAVVHSGLGMALEGLGRHAEADAAFARADERAADAPAEVRQRTRRAYGFAVAARLPARAREAFAEVLRASPKDPEALYGCGMLHDRAGEQREALRYFTLALEAAPAFDEARRARSVILARRGDFQAARRDVNACLGKDNPSPATYYAAACVAALQAERSEGGAAAASIREALQMLREALQRGYGADRAAADDDLKGIQSHPEFRRLLAATSRDRKAD